MNDWLVRHGVILALLGSISGFSSLVVTNPRMGLAAHLGGIMNALLLLALGAAWSAVRLSSQQDVLATRLLVGGAYGNWAITLLASMTGAREFAPLAGAGYGASQFVEKATLILITVAAVCTLTGLGMVLIGLSKQRGARW
jgi:hydroxylaminobenzene mutase